MKKFEARWLEEEECSEGVEEAWEKASSEAGFSLMEIQSWVLGSYGIGIGRFLGHWRKRSKTPKESWKGAGGQPSLKDK
jgi:hypothetical protein